MKTPAYLRFIAKYYHLPIKVVDSTLPALLILPAPSLTRPIEISEGYWRDPKSVLTKGRWKVALYKEHRTLIGLIKYLSWYLGHS